MSSRRVQIDFRLTYDHTTVNNGKSFYYLRGFFLPGDWKTNLLLYFLELELDVDIFPFLQAPQKFPATIEAGTNIYSIDGTAWQTPTDLYLLLVHDFPTGNTLIPAIDDIFSSSPVAVYAEFPPSTGLAPDLPADVSPSVYPPNQQPTYPNFYMPPGSWGLYATNIHAGPYGGERWARFQFFEQAWRDCEFLCSTYYNHVLCNINDYEFLGFTGPYNLPEWYSVVSRDHADPCHNQDEWIGGVYPFEELGDYMVKFYVPLTSPEKIFWFHSDLLGLEPYQYGFPVLPIILMAIPALAPVLRSVAMTPGWRFSKVAKLTIKPGPYGLATGGDGLATGGDGLATADYGL